MTRRRPLRAAAAAVALLLLSSACTTLPKPEAPTDNTPPLVSAGPVLPPPAASIPVPAPAPEPSAATVVELPAQPLPEPLPRGRLDPLQDAARAQLWQRLREGFALPDLDTELVQKWEQWYARDPAYVQRMAQRSGRYLFHIVEEVERRGLPSELALLPFIESAFNPQAMSGAAASGIWQFMPATGKDFELYQNMFRDDRRDVLASTRAALDYLQRLHGMFGNWPLALAAYNWGQGNVTRAINRNKQLGLETDYLSLSPRMPQETREYVPKLQAVKNIVARPENFGLSLPPLSDEPYFLSVPIERDIDVGLVARLSGLSLEEFKQLNPQLNKPLILAAGTPQVLLPYDNANRFITNRSQHKGPLASWTAWVAPRNLGVGQAARQLGIGEDELRALNHIPQGMLIKGGSTLLVPRAAHADDVAEHIADHGRLALAPDLPPLRRVYFKAGRKGDSVAAMSRRFRVSAAQLAQWNGIGVGGHFKAGQQVVVMLPATKAQPARSRANAVKGRTIKATSARPNAKTAAPRAGKAAPAKKASAAKPRR